MLLKQKIKNYYIDLVKGKRKGALDVLFSFLLHMVSFVYGFFVKLFFSCYQAGLVKTYKPNCRVISIGNISWGGTGKTPMTEAVAKHFVQKGKKPAVLIRGYGDDEVYMLQDKLRGVAVLAGRDRIKTARQAQDEHSVDTIILDDGFQHWRMGRDLDIVLVDASFPFGNKKIIPAGILREPLSSLGRADMFVLTNAELAEDLSVLKSELNKYNSQAQLYEAKHVPVSLSNAIIKERQELATLKDRRIGLLCGIANPDSFERVVSSLDAKVFLKFYFTDHHHYRKADLERLEKTCLDKGINTVVTTEKDLPRLLPLLKSTKLSIELLVLGIELKIVENENRFFNLVEGRYDLDIPYSILILSDGKAGHLNQSKAIAKIIQKIKLDQGISSDKINIKVVEVGFKNKLSRLLLEACSLFSSARCRSCLNCLKFCLDEKTFKELTEAKCDVVISCGSSLAAVNLYTAYKNKARKVVLMKPSLISLDRFDLAIIPEHDRVKPQDNIVFTKITPSLIDPEYLRNQAEILSMNYELRTMNYSGPIIGVLIGGDSPKYEITSKLIKDIVFQLKQVAQNINAQILITTSRRTSPEAVRVLKDELASFPRCKLLVIANENNIPEAVGGILGLSDIIVVSAESISMISEALASQKHVLAFRPSKKTKERTRQEIFLEKLEQEGFIKVVQANRLVLEIENIYGQKPVKKITDHDLISTALAKIL